MRKKSFYLGIVMLACLSLTACGGKKKVDYDVTEVSGGTESDAPSEQVAPEDEIPETLTYELVGDMATIKVDANIMLPNDYQTCPVVEFSKDPYEDADIKYYADKIFDKGSYFLYMPYSLEQIAYCREQINSIATGTDDENLRAFIEEYLLFNISYRETVLTGDVEIDGELKFYDIVPYPNDEYPEHKNMCELIGTIDGEYYTLTFEKNDLNSHMNLRRLEYFSTNDVGSECFDMKLTGNVSEYTQDDAEKLARDYVEELGIQGFAVVKVNNTEKYTEDFTNHTSIKQIEGYNIYFGRQYEGYSLTYTSDNFWNNYGQYSSYEGDAEWMSISEMSEYIRVYVDSKGICEVDIVNPLVEKNIATESAVLLDFDSMNQAAKKELQYYVDEYRSNFSIVEIELGYSFVRENGQIALVPAWYFFDDNSGEDRQLYYINACLVINALDGSVIYKY